LQLHLRLLLDLELVPLWKNHIHFFCRSIQPAIIICKHPSTSKLWALWYFKHGFDALLAVHQVFGPEQVMRWRLRHDWLSCLDLCSRKVHCIQSPFLVETT
jgi:hypothetical protein